MSTLLHDFHFLRPGWLLALLALPLVAWLGTRRDPARRELSRIVDPALLPYLLHGRAEHRGLPVGLFALGWTLCALAMAGPSWNRVAEPLYAQRAAQVVAISLSQHMLARDVAPSRLDRALYKARALLGGNRDGLNGLIGYAGEAFVVAPLTTDARSLDDLLEAMAPDTMPVDGDDAAAAIRQGVTMIHDAKAGSGSIVLITDDADADAAAAARAAHADGISVSVLGVGTTQGGPIAQGDGGFLHDARGNMLLAQRDDTALAALASAGGGRYIAMTGDAADITALRATLHADAAPTQVADLAGDEWQDRGPWLLLPVLLIAALAFRRGWLLLLPLIVLPLLPGNASASGWSDWWQRPDQQAAQALRAGDAARAQQLSSDPALRGAAAYRAGDYAAAANAMAKATGNDAPYNLGNALAKQGQYPQANEAYDRALKLDPHNADAKANRDAVEAAMRKQQQQDKDSAKNDKDKQDHGKGKPSDDSKNGSGPSQKGEQQNPSAQDKDPAAEHQPAQSGQDAKQGQAGKDTSSTDPHDADTHAQAPPQTAQEQAAERARAEQAQQALQKQMDQALGGTAGKRAEAPKNHELGATATDDPEAKLPADVRQTLQRVPDDPGALLRRKFDLEYRQRHGSAPTQEDQP
jgi:Ca-activated chloride channel family protein